MANYSNLSINILSVCSGADDCKYNQHCLVRKNASWMSDIYSATSLVINEIKETQAEDKYRRIVKIKCTVRTNGV